MMDQVQEINSSTLGIKLFGATISVKEASSSSSSSASQPDIKRDDDQSQTMAEHKKRPDKIIPCPRCKSMETKFCYFNNYNVNQPRHFCKGCRRYWTDGGALRNVPVGAVRRKSKPPCRSSVVVEECVFLENSGMEKVLDVASKAVAKGWHVVEDGGARHLFPAKRRKCGFE